MRVFGVRVEHHANALGIGEAQPRLSWKVSEVGHDYEQHAYQVEVTSEGVTRSACVTSRDQVLVPWPFEPLSSRQSASIRIRVHSGSSWSLWSDALVLETGILDPALWTAKFISPVTTGRVEDGAPRFSKSILIDGEVTSARLYTTAYGAYRVELNGRQIGDDVLAPGWTSYLSRIKYQTNDVTDLLESGPNLLQSLVGNGWFRGQLVWPENRSSYGSRIAFLELSRDPLSRSRVHNSPFPKRSDGDTYAYEHGEPGQWAILWNNSAAELTISAASGTYRGPAPLLADADVQGRPLAIKEP